MSDPSLSDEQIRHYWDRGYVNRIPVLTANEAASWLDRLEQLERDEIARRGGEWPIKERGYRPWDHPEHPFADFVQELTRTDAVLDAVESVLGPDLLVRNADIFIKEPKVRRGIGWHQDTAEKGPDTDCMLTAWIGLTASTTENGCLRFSSKSHRLKIPGGPKDKYTLTLSREAASHLNAEDTAYNEMDSGMMSMHHFRTVHASNPNTTRARRVGFVVRFMSPQISSETAESGQATLVRGTDKVGNFSLKDRFPMTWSS